jgi:hypothetical protein
MILKLYNIVKVNKNNKKLQNYNNNIKLIYTTKGEKDPKFSLNN